MDAIPLWVLLIGSCAGALLGLECGYQLGQWRQKWVQEEKEAPVGAMVGAILGLLAFMLAFTFSMAATRFDSRRQTVLSEANAIGTTYLRASFLPEPQRSRVKDLLREYVDVRLQSIQQGDVTKGIAESERLHRELWSNATLAGEQEPSSIMIGLFVQSLNEVIDLHSERVLIGLRSRIPSVIWMALFGLALIGMTSIGYQAGLSATRRSPAMVTVAVAFAGVLFLIIDLDRAHEGLLQVSQQAIIDLQKSMQPEQ